MDNCRFRDGVYFWSKEGGERMNMASWGVSWTRLLFSVRGREEGWIDRWDCVGRILPFPGDFNISVESRKEEIDNDLKMKKSESEGRGLQSPISYGFSLGATVSLPHQSTPEQSESNLYTPKIFPNPHIPKKKIRVSFYSQSGRDANPSTKKSPPSNSFPNQKKQNRKQYVTIAPHHEFVR